VEELSNLEEIACSAREDLCVLPDVERLVAHSHFHLYLGGDASIICVKRFE
jgi:hypothetical protein